MTYFPIFRIFFYCYSIYTFEVYAYSIKHLNVYFVKKKMQKFNGVLCVNMRKTLLKYFICSFYLTATTSFTYIQYMYP